MEKRRVSQKLRRVLYIVVYRYCILLLYIFELLNVLKPEVGRRFFSQSIGFSYYVNNFSPSPFRPFCCIKVVGNPVTGAWETVILQNTYGIISGPHGHHLAPDFNPISCPMAFDWFESIVNQSVLVWNDPFFLLRSTMGLRLKIKTWTSN